MELNKIYCESNLDTMARMPDNFVDLTVTSPPYDNLRTYNGYSFPFEEIAKELYRVTKQGGAVVWVVGDAVKNGTESGTSFKQALYFIQCGFNLHDTMIYAKQNYVPLTHNRYEQQFEYMFVFTKGKPKVFNPITIPCIYAGATNHTKHRRRSDAITKGSGYGKQVKETKYKPNIWFYDVGKGKTTNDKVAFEHPAIFPEQLAADHIISWSNEGDLVYDCFMGSGTVGKMAQKLNRNWIGSEISQEYVDIANQRIFNSQNGRTFIPKTQKEELGRPKQISLFESLSISA